MTIQSLTLNSEPAPGQPVAGLERSFANLFRTNMKREREHLERRQKLILRNFQSPGDVTMLTALVRDLEKLHPKRFSIGVETQRRDLWKNNPYIEWELCRFGSDATDEGRDGEAEFMRVEYQLIHKSNQQPQRFIHAMHQFVGERLGLDVYPTAFKGDVHLSAMEREARLGFPNGLDQPDGPELPERYWVMAAGGKEDYTIKWWSRERWQAVVDLLGAEGIAVVQVGATTGRITRILICRA